MKNRKLRKDYKLADHPRATFELEGLRDVVRKDDGSFEATGLGTLRWRGKSVAIEIAGTGVMTGGSVDAKGTFDLDIRDLGMKAPRVLMFKMQDVVTIDVTLRAKAT